MEIPRSFGFHPASPQVSTGATQHKVFNSHLGDYALDTASEPSSVPEEQRWSYEPERKAVPEGWQRPLTFEQHSAISDPDPEFRAYLKHQMATEGLIPRN
jgi:hypothetical protein